MRRDAPRRGDRGRLRPSDQGVHPSASRLLSVFSVVVLDGWGTKDRLTAESGLSYLSRRRRARRRRPRREARRAVARPRNWEKIAGYARYS